MASLTPNTERVISRPECCALHLSPPRRDKLARHGVMIRAARGAPDVARAPLLYMAQGGARLRTGQGSWHTGRCAPKSCLHTPV